MLKYILKRILIFIPTILAVSLLAFAISVNAPGDPVEAMMKGDLPVANVRATEMDYIQMRMKLGLDLPIFYFGLSSMAEPDTLFRIIRPMDRETMKNMVYEFGNWKHISKYFYAVKELDYTITDIKGDSSSRNDRLSLRNHVSQLKLSHTQKSILFHLSRADSLANLHPGSLLPISQKISIVKNKWENLINNQEKWKIYVPAIHFYGYKNQYHRWIAKMLVGDFGVSYRDRRPIAKKIPEALRWTLFISIFSILLAYSISIPIGIRSAVNRDSISDKTLTTSLFILYSLPTFWVATLMIQFLCNPDYLHWFPSNGVQATQHSPDWSLGKRILDWAHHLVLPIICGTYGTIAILSRFMRVGMLEVLGQDYIRTARAKGLGEKVVIMKHALKNSLIPIITLLGGILPSLIAGSIVIEIIFSIPGMGQNIYSAITGRDYPMIIAFFTLFGVLTQLGILLSDVLYALMDPRISFSKK